MLGALHLAIMTNAELVEHGLAAELVTHERERMSGHRRRVQPRWAPSIGMWGGTATITEIAERVGVEVAAAREYAKFRRLRWRTRRREYTSAQLGVLAMAAPGAARDAAIVLGVLPIEAAMYRAAMTEILVENETSLSALLSWSAAHLEAEWSRLGLRIEAPRIGQRWLYEPDYLRRIVAEAERQVRQNPEDDES